MKYNATFKVIRGKDKGKKWRYSFSDDKTVVLGRLKGCHILLRDKKISQSHCLIQIQNGILCIIDMGSLHGSYVNKQKTQGAFPLTDGDKISIGNTQLEIKIIGRPEKISEASSSASFQISKPHFDHSTTQGTLDTKSHIVEKLQSISKTLTKIPACAFCAESSSAKNVIFEHYIYCKNCQNLAHFFLENLVEYRISGLSWQNFSHGNYLIVSNFSGEKEILYITKKKHPNISLTVLQEAEEIAQTKHPHLYPIRKVEMIQDRMVVFLKYLPGKFLDYNFLSKVKVIEMIYTLGKALEYASEHWGYHGEICPQNIYMEAKGIPYLLGYGIVHPFSSLNFSFSAPEIVSQKSTPNHSSDQFSLAATLFFLLTGQKIYRSENLADIIEEAKHFHPNLRKIRILMMKKFLKRALADDPGKRYPGIPHFLDALRMVQCSYR